MQKVICGILQEITNCAAHFLAYYLIADALCWLIWPDQRSDD